MKAGRKSKIEFLYDILSNSELKADRSRGGGG